ncbi:metallophosphoesterase (plasmid) [Halostagnicola larsenii XH-48]|uniref:Metallophosphoesterase n=1 Tax=Halostagnicola larsenii XH-48 TaxID=797299 RepID=W0JW84_9EURY|nr:metallophosphoesterase family protein [Halostagnicola larsenii]AHG01313.1 metallophosphoesterase [Halostagnicola larsenii XH-48]
MTRTVRSFDAVAFDHRRIDLENYDDVYIVGDVHGCLEDLETLLSVLDLGDRDLAVFVGDLVRKGPDSKAVLDRIDASSKLLSVRGNNEQKLLDGQTSLPNFGECERRIMESFPTAISWADGLVVHGGVDPARTIGDHSREDVLTMRSPEGNGYDGPFWFEEYDGPPRIFFGHTVLNEPFESESAVGLDTGCVYGGSLTAYDIGRDRFVTVESEGYVNRSDDKIVATNRQ